MRTALITGSNGFIGDRLCKSLIAKDWRVIGVDITEENNEYEFVRKDARFLLVDDIPAEQIDVVFHCACYAEPKKYLEDPLFILDSCFNGTLNLLNIAKQFQATFVFLSSVDVERQFDTQDIKSSYIVGKLSAEQLCSAYKDQLNVKVVRLNNVYGDAKDTDTRVVPTFVRAVKSGKPINITENSTRNFCYVWDVVSELIEISTANSNTFIYELSGELITIQDLALTVEKTVFLKTQVEQGLRKFL
ncbi:WcaG Nucleoside-diphosphate-sugar epimerases [uncultured Caudovirales phage]|uniref:WcaG Nucleoside-diphosphate-sugar epimerases n=1 Tax=uncultured Caudovirales phage TaxID=2100421 RepID=A0A6J5KRZ0_9CAUD|nr:WcaG Nucleoside-diphosphate-sugar epimerases [uncultured Caudovirales phage]CAB4124032.1 WcaG Nucleoside-diphosphate-sugar epimerases [uncultured Caudovirales phage]CAB5219702.1 WcaG Nucleoside-diphosphate-sugar epimerases [uncultured Caudovirales phage]